MADCVHAIDLCPDCDGLRVVEATRFEAAGLRIESDRGPIVSRGPVTITLSPFPGPCPNPHREEAARG